MKALVLPGDGVDALLLSHAALPFALQGIIQLQIEIEEKNRLRREAAASATARRDQASVRVASTFRVAEWRADVARSLAADLQRVGGGGGSAAQAELDLAQA